MKRVAASRACRYKHWVVMLRPAQLTLGTLVLCCKERAESFGEISPGAFAEQKRAVMELEATLRGLPFGASKINYLMLMMRDPQVHYHVLPRYLEDREFDGVTFSDEPGPPVLSRVARLGGHTLAKLQRLLIDNWHIEDDGGEATPKL
jgi:diadenosine tetraphosphate (Ap4A) HIT family hydrolase